MKWIFLYLKFILFMMNEPATPFLLFNYYDFLILIVVITNSIILNKKRVNLINKRLAIVFKVLFLFVFIPYLSIQIEINNAVAKKSIDDSFTLLYTFFKIPIWWFIGIVVLFYLSLLDFRKFIN